MAILDSFRVNGTDYDLRDNSKIPTQQGSANAGKALVVGRDGVVTTGDAGIPDAVKVTLLDLLRHVAYIDDQGQAYYNALYTALYNEPAPGPSPTPSTIIDIDTFALGSAYWGPKYGYTITQPPDNKIACANLSEIAFEEGDVISVSGARKAEFKFNLGTGNNASSPWNRYWIKNESDNDDYEVFFEVIDDLKVMRVVKTDDSTITQSDLDYLNANVKVIRPASMPAWQYDWDASSGVNPTGMTANSFDFSAESGALKVSKPYLSHDHTGNFDFVVVCKFATAIGNNYPRIGIVMTNAALDNNFAVYAISNMTNDGQSGGIVLQYNWDAATNQYYSSDQTVYRAYRFVVRNGVAKVYFNGKLIDTYTYTSHDPAGTNINAVRIQSANNSDVAFIKQIRFRNVSA